MKSIETGIEFKFKYAAHFVFYFFFYFNEKRFLPGMFHSYLNGFRYFLAYILGLGVARKVLDHHDDRLLGYLTSSE